MERRGPFLLSLQQKHNEIAFLWLYLILTDREFCSSATGLFDVIDWMKKDTIGRK